MRTFHLVAVAALALPLTACPKDQTEMTSAEASEALDESNASSQAAALTATSVDISTNFTIGQAVEQAAQNLKDFIATELPCADVSLSGNTLSITYGAKPGSCTYKGQTFSGTHQITVTKNDQNEVIVDHTWANLSNGIVTVNGSAHVTWDAADPSRNAQYSVMWTRKSDGLTGTGTGDVTQKPLPDGLDVGIQIDGSRTWKGPSGEWDLGINGVQARWQDPIPQAGSYSLHTPKDRTITLSFSRVDDTTIKVTASSGSKSFSFNVKGPAGDVTAQ